MNVFEISCSGLGLEHLINNFLPEEIDGFVVDSMSIL